MTYFSSFFDKKIDSMFSIFKIPNILPSCKVKVVDLKGSISNLKERLARVKQKQQQRLEKLQALKDHYQAKAQSNHSELLNKNDSLTDHQPAQEDDNTTVDEETSDVSFF